MTAKLGRYETKMPVKVNLGELVFIIRHIEETSMYVAVMLDLSHKGFTCIYDIEEIEHLLRYVGPISPIFVR